MQIPRKCSQAQIDRARVWALAHPERKREIQRAHYWRNHVRKFFLPPFERLEKLCERVPFSGCWLWLGAVTKFGYGKITVDGNHTTAHRWSWTLRRGPIPDGLHVLHKCDVPACVNPDHLFLGTALDNDQDKRRKGRHYVLPIQRNPKLTEEQVADIRRLRGLETIVSLGKKFSVHHSVVSRIQRGKSWAHIPLRSSDHL